MIDKGMWCDIHHKQHLCSDQLPNEPDKSKCECEFYKNHKIANIAIGCPKHDKPAQPTPDTCPDCGVKATGKAPTCPSGIHAVAWVSTPDSGTEKLRVSVKTGFHTDECWDAHIPECICISKGEKGAVERIYQPTEAVFNRTTISNPMPDPRLQAFEEVLEVLYDSNDKGDVIKWLEHELGRGK